MTELLLHQRTQLALDHFLAQPSHGLLVVGPPGAGKKSLAMQLLTEVLQQPLTNYQYFLHITPKGKSISIDDIRQATQFVRLKTKGERPLRRAILVENAHLLTIEAQNAFLKLLEEPPADTIIVLTATSLHALLPTISSRTQVISTHPLEQSTLVSYYSQDHAQADVVKAFYISGGQPGLMQRVLAPEEGDPLLSYIDMAKKVLQLPLFDRLIYVDELVKQKTSLSDLLWALQTVAQSALQQAVVKGQSAPIKKWHHINTVILETKEGLSANPLPKLLLTNLSLQL